MALFEDIRLYLRMIRFSHSIFALPFAFMAAVLGAGGVPPWREVFWIVVAMVGARSGAMGLNRVIDRGIDALNPRTRGREIPAGKIGVAEATAFSLVSLAVMVFAAAMLNPLCLRLSPIAIAILVLYSFTKRFTWAAHMVLGLALSLAPLGAWVAVRGTLDMKIIPLVLAVVFWLPGFDIIYALMDVEFDRAQGIHSIPARFGVRRSLLLARLFHVLAWMGLVLTGLVFDLGPIYAGGMVIVALLFVYEHAIVCPGDNASIGRAFNLNGYIGIIVFVATFLDLVFG
jgi:4-hydroxybenzoate polyprenyltransferase